MFNSQYLSGLSWRIVIVSGLTCGDDHLSGAGDGKGRTADRGHCRVGTAVDERVAGAATAGARIVGRIAVGFGRYLGKGDVLQRQINRQGAGVEEEVVIVRCHCPLRRSDRVGAGGAAAGGGCGDDRRTAENGGILTVDKAAVGSSEGRIRLAVVAFEAFGGHHQRRFFDRQGLPCRGRGRDGRFGLAGGNNCFAGADDRHRRPVYCRDCRVGTGIGDRYAVCAAGGGHGKGSGAVALLLDRVKDEVFQCDIDRQRAVNKGKAVVGCRQGFLGRDDGITPRGAAGGGVSGEARGAAQGRSAFAVDEPVIGGREDRVGRAVGPAFVVGGDGERRLCHGQGHGGGG